MAFTLTFPTSGARPQVDDVATWLTDRGEPFEREGQDTLALRALPVRLLLSNDQPLLGQLQITSTAPLGRLVDMVFAMSVHIGADVKLTGVGPVTRASLWLRLADEQDRRRLSEALLRAEEHGKLDDVLKRLWAIIGALRPGHDDRWDPARGRVVELVEVGVPGGLTVEQAKWHADDPQPGDTLPVPVQGFVHTLAWRWLSEAYPGLAEGEHTLH